MNIETSGIDYFCDDIAMAADEPATLERLTNLAVRSNDLGREIDRLSVEVAELVDQRNNILRNLIPTVMDELGITAFDLVDGSKIGIREVINASISEANKPAAFRWLEENEFDGIIKTRVHSEFGKGEIEDAKRARAALVDAGFMVELDQSVHNSTLKSFVKEQLEEGNAIPVDIFGVHQFKEAKITPPKAAKKRK